MAMHSASSGENVQVRTTELLGPTHSDLLGRLEELQRALFAKIPGLPSPSLIDHLLIIIRQDLSVTAYINELQIQAMVKINRDIQAGTPVFPEDISEISTVDLGLQIPPECAVVFVRSRGWRRSLFFDFSPLAPEHGPRNFDLGKAVAQQELLLLGLPPVPLAM